MLKRNMKFKDYTWDKEFEIKGYFSDYPDNIISPNNLSGILHYSPREIVLELLGILKKKQVFHSVLVNIWKRYMVFQVTVIF